MIQYFHEHGKQASVKRKISFTSFTAFYYARRILLGLTVVFGQYLVLQMASMTFQFTVMIILLGYRPLSQSFANKFEFFNEATIMVVLYFMLCFSDANTKLDHD